MQFLKKLGLKLPYDPEIPQLGIYPEKITIQKDTWANPQLCPGKVQHGMKGSAFCEVLQEILKQNMFLT